MTAMRKPSIIIIGAGFGGIGMAVELRDKGFDEVTILERSDDLGGVWRDNTYPGLACDVPSSLYSYSFAPKSDWRQRYSGGTVIHDYLCDVAGRYGVRDAIHFGADVTDAEFDEATGRWSVHTADGAVRTADVLIPAVGQLSRPAIPTIPGIDTFAGVSFHSAEWDHSVELAGKRVACVGTGASAIQFVPALQPEVAHLTLFQRTPAWVVPKMSNAYPPAELELHARVPGILRFERLLWWIFFETTALGLVDLSVIRWITKRVASLHLAKQVEDPRLRAELTPDYPVFCKRVLLSNDYYPALTQPNVRVETTPITEITQDGVRTTDNVVHQVDAIIYGTGFKGAEFLWPMNIYGRGGHKLADVWAEGAHAYYGMTVPEFPNLFLLYGPNTNLSVGSIVYMIESQTRYISQAVQLLADHPGHYLDVRADIEERYNTTLRQRLDRSPWSLCSNWYRDSAGRITNNWPGSPAVYRYRTRRFRPGDYILVPAA
ncbi:flavin-containing monooxygenase [Nocardia sp. 004]|uniref:flavin-containing monooxygenase n=1 Tax=Nocardia sp. 004 TaxID=3385978 RepID=UPI00399FC05C